MRRLAFLALLATSAGGAIGCRAVEAPDAVVAPGVTAATQAPTPEPWLESATLVCLPATPAPSALPAAESGVAQAAFAPATSAEPSALPASVEAPPSPRTVRILAIRYPHPDGRRDVARAELIVADASAETSANASWRSRLGRTMSGVMPGVAWGPGIRRAVGLDVPVSELQAVVAAAQQPCAAGATVSAPATALVRLDVNGQSAAIASSAPPERQRLADRVDREGRVISYRGSASELLAAAGR
jgi:DNA polymerase-3 subunit gamma/tau